MDALHGYGIRNHFDFLKMSLLISVLAGFPLGSAPLRVNIKHKNQTIRTVRIT